MAIWAISGLFSDSFRGTGPDPERVRLQIEEKCMSFYGLRAGHVEMFSHAWMGDRFNCLHVLPRDIAAMFDRAWQP